MTAPTLNGSTAAAAPEVVARLRARVSDRLAGHGEQLPDGERHAVIAGYIAEELLAHAREDIAAGRVPLTPQAEAALARALRDSFTGLGGLQRLIDDPRVEDIFANGCDNVWIRTTDGQVQRVPPVAASDDDLVDIVRIAAARSGQEERRFDRGSPGLSLRLPGGQRLFAVMAVAKRPSLSIRRNTLHRVTLDDLMQRGEITVGLRELIRALVRARKNIVICGGVGVGVGKTTMLGHRHHQTTYPVTWTDCGPVRARRPVVTTDSISLMLSSGCRLRLPIKSARRLMNCGSWSAVQPRGSVAPAGVTDPCMRLGWCLVTYHSSGSCV